MLIFYSFSNAQLFSSGNNTISGNKVGVGENLPETTLDVKSSTIPGTTTYLHPFKVTAKDRVLITGESTYWQVQEKPAIFVNKSAKVGIKTENPLEEIHLNGLLRGGEGSGAFKIKTDYGFLKMGAENPHYAHFDTDMPAFKFSKKIVVDGGVISSLNNDLFVQTNHTTRVIIRNTTGNVEIRGGNFYIKDNTGVNQFKVDNNGNVRAREIKVDLAAIPDYVFSKDYKLMPLAEVKEFIEANKHLPNVKSEKQFKEEGSISLNEMNMKLLEKVEELTLYVLDLQAQINELKK